MKSAPYATGHKKIDAYQPMKMKPQPVEGTTDGYPAGKGNDATSRSPQPAYQVIEKKPMTRETMGEQPFGMDPKPGRRGYKGGKR